MTHLLDSSALFAFVFGEPGQKRVEAFLADSSVSVGPCALSALEWWARLKTEGHEDAFEHEWETVILGFVWPVARALMEAGWRFPEDAGFAAVIGPKPGEIDPQIRRISGCSPNYDAMHRRAMRQPRDMLGRGERGMTTEPSEQVIEPDWLPGETPEKRRLPAS